MQVLKLITVFGLVNIYERFISQQRKDVRVSAFLCVASFLPSCAKLPELNLRSQNSVLSKTADFQYGE